MNAKLPQEVRELVERVAGDLGIEVYHAEMAGRTLRVEIEQGESTTLDTCTAYSRALSAELDASGRFEDRYFLEVSSPGVDRFLRRPAHYIKAIGSTVKIKTASETVEGTLGSADDGSVTLMLQQDGEPRERTLTYDEIRSARVRVRTAELFTARTSARQARTEDGA